MQLNTEVAFKFRSSTRMMSRIVILTIALASLVIAELTGIPRIPTVQDYIVLEEKCADILNISAELRAQIARHRYPDTVESHRLTYCLGALFYGYSDQDGLDMDLMFTLYGQGETRQEFDRQTEICMEENGVFEPGLNKYAKVYRIYLCFAEQYERIFNS